MSYNLTLVCGCLVYVACNPKSGIAHTRVLETKGPACGPRRHEVGLRLYLWEILPDPAVTAGPVFVSDGSRMTPI